MKSFVLFLVDNNTWNNSHIALVGKAMSSNESAAFEIMTELDVDYVLGKGDLTLFLRHEDSFCGDILIFSLFYDVYLLLLANN